MTLIFNYAMTIGNMMCSCVVASVEDWFGYKRRLETEANVGEGMHGAANPETFPVLVITNVQPMIAGTYGNYANEAAHTFVSRQEMLALLGRTPHVIPKASE